MPDAKNNLYLYEALELRAEYDARIKELKRPDPRGEGDARPVVPAAR